LKQWIGIEEFLEVEEVNCAKIGADGCDGDLGQCWRLGDDALSFSVL